jgi:hypothetical protein
VNITSYLDELKSLHDAGGWIFAAACIGAMLFATIKGMVVPRFLYDEQRDRADRALDQQDDALTSLGQLTKSVDTITTALIMRSSKGSE